MTAFTKGCIGSKVARIRGVVVQLDLHVGLIQQGPDFAIRFRGSNRIQKGLVLCSPSHQDPTQNRSLRPRRRANTLTGSSLPMAWAIAAAQSYVEREQIAGQTLVAVACGANMDFDRLSFVAERAELGERREAVFAVTIPEHPGSLRAFCQYLGSHNLTEFNYRIADERAATFFVGIQIQNRADAAEIAMTFAEHGFPTIDLTDNELAKLHLRYMVGGRSPLAEHELLYRFEFPERPGALIKFLNCMSPNWNIRLFHYRNHGSDCGRVLVGMQVPPEDTQAWQAFLDNLGYRYWDESQNPAYQLFLS
jgi:threonine dehydratase